MFDVPRRPRRARDTRAGVRSQQQSISSSGARRAAHHGRPRDGHRAVPRVSGRTAGGRLFFGDQKSATDFLYREEIEAFQNDGLLTRLDLAWSRDQAEKIYVQHRMLQHAKELYAWLEEGGSFFVCGDASRMAKDVNTALHQIIQAASGKSAQEAAAYVAALNKDKRYQRDIY